MAKLAQDSNSHLEFVLSVLKNAQPLSVDWSGVAQDNGIGYARNATPKFREILKKYGYKFESNQVMNIEDEGSMPANPKPTRAPKSLKTKEKPKVTQKSKKRKLETVGEEDEAEVDSMKEGTQRLSSDVGDED